MSSSPGAVLDTTGLAAFCDRDSHYDEDLVDAGDVLDTGGFDYFTQPRSVADTLLEISLFGAGPEAVRLLESLQGRDVTPAQALDVAEAWERQARWLSTRTAAANLAFVGLTEETERDARRAQSSRVLELGLVIDCSDVLLAQVKLPQARLLATTLSATRALIDSGELSDYRGRMICDKLAVLARTDPDAARAVEAEVLINAATIQMKSLADKLRRLVQEARPPEEVLTEYVDGAADRKAHLDTEPPQPGLLGLHAQLPAEVTLAVWAALEAKAGEFARADKKKAAADKKAAANNSASRHPGPADDDVHDAAGGCAGDPAGGSAGDLPAFARRTRDQRLADALAWFVLGPDEHDDTRPAKPKFLLQLTMSLPVLLALREGSAVLPGYGPIPPEIAREWAQDADWQRFVHEPVTGHLLDDGVERYRQRARMRRYTRHRDVTDRFPGSNRSARHCDGDHTKPFTGDAHGGSTSSANIANTGRIGHIAKTHNGWTVHGNANGVLIWRSPHGRTHRTTPHDYSDPPPPTRSRPDTGPPPF